VLVYEELDIVEEGEDMDERSSASYDSDFSSEDVTELIFSTPMSSRRSPRTKRGTSTKKRSKRLIVEENVREKKQKVEQEDHQQSRGKSLTCVFVHLV